MGRQLFDRFLIFIAVAIVWLALLHALMPPRPPLLLEATTKTVQPVRSSAPQLACPMPPKDPQEDPDEPQPAHERDTFDIA